MRTTRPASCRSTSYSPSPCPLRHPNRWDLEAGAYFRRAALHDTLGTMLERHRVALIVAPPGHGKTALARAFGWEWCLADPRRELFYLSVQSQDKDFLVWEQSIHAFDRPEACYVIDDAHLEVEAVTAFVSLRQRFSHARLILISRPLEPASRGELPDSYFEDLAAQSVPIDTADADWLPIARAMTGRPDLGAAELGDPERLLQRCAGDLHLLEYLAHGPTTPSRVRPWPNWTRPRSINWSSGATRRGGAHRRRCSPWRSWDSTRSRSRPLGCPNGRASTTSSPTAGPIDRWDGLADAARVIHVLWRQEGSPKQGSAHDQWRRVQGAINEGLPVFTKQSVAEGFSWFLFFAWRFEPQIYLRALAHVDAEQLGRISASLGLSTVNSFLCRASQAGVDKGALRSFCDGLDYADLGRRSRDVGLATVQLFLSTASRAGVDKADLKVFCDGLDFRDLGRRSRDTGLATVANFMQLAWRVGVSDDALSSFAAGLDFRSLGRAFGRGCEPDDEGMRSASLNTLIWAARNRGVSIHQAREFVLGWGFPNILLATRTFLSPDRLFVLFELLQQGCRYSEFELAQEGLNPANPALWLRAFAEHPATSNVKFRRLQQRPLVDAVSVFRASLTPQVWPALRLHHWNTLYHNLGLADPALPESLLWPALMDLLEPQRDRLLADADLRDLVTFLTRFRPGEAYCRLKTSAAWISAGENP